ncbi:hypothetical protein [Acidiphilium acidophilum]|uniref:hypothetical protein n=1 Tax=Acidiphilium acidophilum TaxID=76588 RepID=UPI002E8E6284|nr:hypothetical protein [Acidiphilium acidophilum]
MNSPGDYATQNFHTLQDATSQAADWFNGLEALVLSLEGYPSRGTPTVEDGKLRHLLYGTRPSVYRVIYAIDEVGRLSGFYTFAAGLGRLSIPSALSRALRQRP